jgi:putative zinc finger protein
MACPSDERLIRFAGGDAPTNDMPDIEKHIDGCEKCRKELTFIRGLEATLPELVRTESTLIFPTEECPGAPGLAGYLDGAGSVEERSRIEAHLARCHSCVHEVMVAADQLAAPQEYRKAPIDLRDQAIRLGALATSAEVSTSDGLWWNILQCFKPALAHPRWLAGAGACAVAALAILIVSQLYQPQAVVSPGGGPTLNKLAEHDGGAASRAAEDVVAESRIELSGDLKQALIDHDPKRGAESRSDLFEIIEKKAPQMPVHKIKDVEIKQNLLIAIASVNDLAGQVKLQLYKDGLLVISADS